MRTNHITVRDESYEVSELSGATMIGVRKRLADTLLKDELEAYVVSKCCLKPEFKDTKDVAEKLPFAVIQAIYREAFRLSKDGEDEDPKEETPVES
jgi:hypothetical protein